MTILAETITAIKETLPDWPEWCVSLVSCFRAHHHITLTLSLFKHIIQGTRCLAHHGCSPHYDNLYH